MRDEGWRVVDQQLEELPPVVPDDWGSVMTTSEYLPWVPVDEPLVESLGLTKAYDTFQFGGDGQWQRTWRVVRSRPPIRSSFTTYNRIRVDHHRKTVETLCVMVSILGHGIANISEGETDTDSHRDEHGGLLTGINMTHEKLAGIGSDKLPSFHGIRESILLVGCFTL
jgi:hypothetical protein